jgi:hypothetical protein
MQMVTEAGRRCQDAIYSFTDHCHKLQPLSSMAVTVQHRRPYHSCAASATCCSSSSPTYLSCAGLMYEGSNTSLRAVGCNTKTATVGVQQVVQMCNVSWLMSDVR